MNNFCFLNLKIPLFKEGITVNDLPKTHIAIIDREKIINENIFQFFKSLNLKISLVETFYKTPGATGSIHTDVDGGDYTKLNWVFGGRESQMCWYKPKARVKKRISVTSANTRYLSFNALEVDEIERTPITGPVLVQVGIPHHIINVKESRYCVSFVFLNQNNQRLTMKESVNVFKDYIL
jgi:hypothetical protein